MKAAKFKDSPLGPIPQDWEVKRLGEIAPLQRGFDLPTKELQEGPFPVVYSNGICNYHVEAMCDAPGLVTGRSGTIGHFTFIESGRYWPHNTALWVTSFKGNDPLYIKYLYETLHFENFATGSGVPTLNRNAIHEYKVALPSKIKEQQRIAEALGEVDKLIESLDEQIEKKRLIAKGVAHDLLSGKKRLPGFKGEWKNVRLGDIGEIIRGVSYSPNNAHSSFVDGTIKLLRANNVQEGRIIFNDLVYVDSQCVSQEQRMLRGDILICAANGSKELVGKAASIDYDFETTFGAFMMVLRPNSEITGRFLKHYFVSHQYRNQLDDVLTGSAINNLNGKAVCKFTVALPLSLAEQQAIADLLNELDVAIAALEAKREKYVRIKEGMMRDLLTGKVRMKGE